MNTQFTGEQEKLLHDIGILSFVVIELSLYLDTHPTDQNALKYFNHYNRLANQARQEYSAKFTPLTISCADQNAVTGNGRPCRCPGKEAVINVEL